MTSGWITTIKPDWRWGPVSILSGVTEGIHPPFAHNYIRRIINEDSASERSPPGVQPDRTDE